MTEPEEPTGPAPENIDQAIAAVYAKVSYVQKERKPGLNYSFAGEAAIIEVIRPAMVANGITLRVIEVPEFRTDSFTSKSGTTMNQTLLRARMRFTHAASQTFVDCEALGEGMDSGDKSANKAMTGAYKYAIRQTFMLETGDDPDNSSSDDQERQTPRGKEQGAPPPARNSDNPYWLETFANDLKARDMKVSDCISVIPGLTKENYVAKIDAWLREGDNTVGSLFMLVMSKKAIAQAEAAKEGAPF